MGKSVFPARVLFAQMNRLRLPEGRTAREKTYWPMVASGSPDAVGEYAEFQPVAAHTPGQALEGFCRIRRGRAVRYDALRPDYRGSSAYWECEAEAASFGIEWEGEAPASSGTAEITYVFVGQCEESRTANRKLAQMDLLLDHRRLITFCPAQSTDQIWTEGKVRLEFRPMEKCKNPSGVFFLHLPADAVAAGKAPVFSVRYHPESSASAFYLKGYTDAARYDFYANKSGGAGEKK